MLQRRNKPAGHALLNRELTGGSYCPPASTKLPLSDKLRPGENVARLNTPINADAQRVDFGLPPILPLLGPIALMFCSEETAVAVLQLCGFIV